MSLIPAVFSGAEIMSEVRAPSYPATSQPSTLFVPDAFSNLTMSSLR